MRKLFSVIVIALLCVNGVRAQGKFEPQVKVTAELGIDKYKNKSAGVELLAGYRINESVRVGVGAGISWCDLLYTEAYYDNIINRMRDKYSETASYIPVFVSGKWTISNSSVSPYINIDLGYTIFNPASDYAKENKMGVFVKPAVGLDFGKGWFVEAGYRYQARKCEYWNGSSNSSIPYSQASLSIGYHF